jgi:hypothetical protein
MVSTVNPEMIKSLGFSAWFWAEIFTFVAPEALKIDFHGGALLLWELIGSGSSTVKSGTQDGSSD